MQTKLSQKNITENLNRKGVRVKQWCVKKSPKKKGALKKWKNITGDRTQSSLKFWLSVVPDHTPTFSTGVPKF